MFPLAKNLNYLSFYRYVRVRLKPQEFCKATDNTVTPSRLLQSLINTKTRSPGKVLIVNKTSYSKGYKAVTEILSAHRIGYKSTVAGKNLPDLIKVTRNVGKYGVIVFEDFRTYINMDPWNRDLLDKYCKTYNVGIIAFVPIEDQLGMLAINDSSSLFKPLGGKAFCLF